MAATNFTPISLYYSSTASAAPTAGNLVAGELAINTADGKLFYKDSAGVVQVIGTKGGVGSSTTTQVLYNSSGLVVGSANMTFNGTTLTLANDASISGLTVGKGGGALATNTAIGASALAATNTGGYSVAVGGSAGAATTSGQIVAVGHSALFTNSTGSQNTAVGISSMYSNTTGSNSISVGTGALFSNTTGGNNSALGYQALNANTTASNNTAVGYQAFYSNTIGTYNTAIGYQAGYSQTSGANYCTFIGYQAGYTNTAGDNSAFGYRALYANTSGTSNTAIGELSLSASTTGSNNTALGLQAGTAITTGGSNVCVGGLAGSNLTGGLTSTYVGYNSQASGVNAINELVVCAGTGTGKGTSTGFINAGGGGVYQGNNSATWSITSDARLKKNIVNNTTGLDAISQIQVRNFEYRTKDEINDLPSQNAININGVQLGAIAQELKEILPECVKTESTGVMSVDTTNLTWYLINAVKELSAQVTALQAQVTALENK